MIGTDRVQVMKQESTSNGGDDADIDVFGSPTPIEPQEDALESAGIFVQDESNRDETVGIHRDGTTLRFFDGDSGNGYPGKSLTDLAGFSEENHRQIYQLTHGIDQSCYEEYTYDGWKPTAVTVWETDEKLKKIRESQYTWSGSNVTQEVIMQYDSSGALSETLTSTYAYSGGKMTSVTVVRS